MSAAVDRLVSVVEALRDHCPWTAALTHPELTSYLVEEAHEAVAEIELHDADAWADVPARRADGSYAALAGELGDILFQVVLHAAVSRAPGAPREEAGFCLDDAAEALTAKMIRRNPLVFTPEGGLRSAQELAGITPEAVELAWERVKTAEREGREQRSVEGTVAVWAAPGEGEDPVAAARSAEGPTDGGRRDLGSEDGSRTDRFGDIPASLPALAAATLMVDRAARQDPDPLAAMLGPAVEPASDWADEGALGAALFALVRRARAAGLDPERALRREVTRLRHG